MKLFVELVACCGCPSTRHADAEEIGPLVPSTAAVSSDEHNNNIIMYKSKRRRRRRPMSAGSFPQWKPSLSSISEDADANYANAASNRNLKKKVATANSRPGNHHRRNKTRINSLSAMVAAFAPTPFLI